MIVKQRVSERDREEKTPNECYNKDKDQVWLQFIYLSTNLNEIRFDLSVEI